MADIESSNELILLPGKALFVITAKFDFLRHQLSPAELHRKFLQRP
jgi:hypothetical protein